MSSKSDGDDQEKVMEMLEDIMEGAVMREDAWMAIIEADHIHKNGYSLFAEKFANFLISHAVDGEGFFSFGGYPGLEPWSYSKMFNLVSFNTPPADLYKSLDFLINSGEGRTASIVIFPFGENGKADLKAGEARMYLIHGFSIRPFNDEEVREVAASLSPDTFITLVRGEEWEYNPYTEYLKLEISE